MDDRDSLRRSGWHLAVRSAEITKARLGLVQRIVSLDWYRIDIQLN